MLSQANFYCDMKTGLAIEVLNMGIKAFLIYAFNARN